MKKRAACSALIQTTPSRCGAVNPDEAASHGARIALDAVIARRQTARGACVAGIASGNFREIASKMHFSCG
jgi:hypothetical protein